MFGLRPQCGPLPGNIQQPAQDSALQKIRQLQGVPRIPAIRQLGIHQEQAVNIFNQII